MDARMLWMAGLLLAVLPGCNKNDAVAVRSDVVADPAKAAAAPAEATGHATSSAMAPREAVEAVASGPAARRATPSDPAYLAGESRLLSGNTLSAAKAEAVFGAGKGFEAALRQFDEDAARNPDAQDLTALYRAAATRALGTDVVLASLSCGYSVCMGEVRSRSEDGFPDWVDAFGKDGSAPQYALMTAELPLGEGESAGRFVFSIDPAANGITQ